MTGTHLWSFFLLVALPTAAAWSQSQPKAKATVCVALISNMSTRSVMEDRLTQRLSKALSGDKIAALAMESATTTDRKLHPTNENGEEAKKSQCDYILLTQISDPKVPSLDQPAPQISIGRRPPSIDASDPMGGSSGPVYRDNLQINFALFRTDVVKPVLDTLILAQPSGSVSDNLLSAMDREANRVGHDLKKR